jgi:phosphatidylglycerol:prolipoprotein diacylglycerol transferase
MYPTIFHIPILNIPIYGYGLMMVFAFLATQWLASKLAAMKGLDPELFVNVALIALVAGVVGARASHVLENFSYYTNPKNGLWDNFLNIINIRSGGLTFYGGLILAAPVVLAYLLKKRVPPRLAMDIVAPCITLGLAIGRVGCFLNGCCYGAPANVPWAVQFPYGSSAYSEAFDQNRVKPPADLIYHPDIDHYRLITPEEIHRGYVVTGDPEKPRFFLDQQKLATLAAAQHAPPVHPAQLYSTWNSLLMTALLLCYFFTPHAAGRVFALMLMLEGPTRFILEMLRVEPPVLGPMSLSMVIGLILLVIGIVLWFAFGGRSEAVPSTSPLQPAA